MKKRLVLSAFLLLGLISPVIPASFSSDAASVLAEDETHYVFVGDTVTVEKRTLVHDGESRSVSGTILYPDGSSRQGHGFTVTETGAYKVLYRAYFGFDEVSQTVSYVCKNRGRDLFSGNDSVSFSYGDYRHPTRTVSHSGVICDVSSGAEFQCDLEFDATKWDIDTPMLEYIVDPTTEGTPDFTSFSMTMTDVEDPDSTVTLDFLRQSNEIVTAADNLPVIRVRAGFNGGLTSGYHEDIDAYYTGSCGTPGCTSFEAVPKNLRANSLKIYFDYAEKALYLSGVVAGTKIPGKALINDLDSAEWYKSNPWTGFTSGRVKISFSIYNFQSSSGRMLISSIGGIDLSEDVVEDVSAPTITVDYAGQDPHDLPDARIGTAYPLYDAVAQDNIDGRTSPSVSITYHDTERNRDTDVSINDNAFTPKKEGKYTIHYTATDRQGNQSSQDVTVRAVRNVTPLFLSLSSTSAETTVCGKATVPSLDDVTVTGGTGKIALSRVLYNPNGDEIPLSGNEFTPEKAGEYYVNYYAEDYIGNHAMVSFSVNVKTLEKPTFFTEPVLPPVFIKGFTYTLDSYSAKENAGSEIRDVTAVPFINDVMTRSGTFIASGDSVTVSYYAEGESGDTMSRDYVIPVIDVNDTIDQAAYFHSADSSVTGKLNRNDVTLTAHKDGSATFANPLDMSDFRFFGKFGVSDYDSVSFTFANASRNDDSLTFTVYPSEGKILYPGAREAVSYVIKDDQFLLNFRDGVLYDINYDETCSVSVNDQGSAYSGYEDGAYLTISFSGVTSPSTLIVQTIDNQSFGSFGDSSMTDYIEPSIVISSSAATEQDIGNTLVIPSAKAFDVMSYVTGLTVTVTEVKTDTVLYEGDVSGLSDFTYVLPRSSVYNVSYMAVDAYHNETMEGEFSKTIYVYDKTNPELHVDPLKKTEYKLGEAVTIPSYTASDDNSWTVDVILVMPDNEMRLLTHDENGDVTYLLNDSTYYPSSFIKDKKSFRTEETGTYRLRFVCYDEEYNKTEVEYTFTVHA